MINLAILLVVGVIAKQAYGDEPEAIVGGSRAISGQFPYQISLRRNGLHLCGGSIIGPKHIVTAAHCVEDMEQSSLTVVTGSISSRPGHGQKHEIECIQVHPGYTGLQRDGWKDDICVITLKKPITMSNVQNVISLASRDYATGSYRGVISGFGKTSVNSDVSPDLLYASVNILSRKACTDAHPKRSWNGAFTNENHICTMEQHGIGACQGDSGGPLVINGELCGVTSWVVPCAMGYPDVFTAVYPYLSWIKECQQRCIMKLAILLVVGVIAKQAYGDEPEAIVGGSRAIPGQFPYQISLQYWDLHICGGSIIGPKHIITAAHCVEDLNQKYMTVVTGSTRSSGDGQSHEIECIQVHPGYTGQRRDGWKDDICLITLKKPIVMSKVQDIIPLASKDYATGDNVGTISGFGKTSVDSDVSADLLYASVNILSSKACLDVYPKNSGGNAFTNENHICTLAKRGIGACQGDSGGPLISNGQLVGVTSWVRPCALGVPDVFTGVYAYLSWIKECQQRC
ncbi:transmembrane protease serine 9-like [Odontomachus brunneus]|uniref:transmembrane protease serine 9-like n=1 Tax=Odontomachus brunneus TaxID=486640 RepID=UPI0013F1F2F8|nr:transmembrane protease serine 9-like [Odontomachus brunneus]